MNKLTERVFEATCKDVGQRPARGRSRRVWASLLTSFSAPDWCEVEWQGVLNLLLRTGTWLFFLTASGSERKDEVSSLKINYTWSRMNVLVWHTSSLPERSTWGTRPHSSCRQRCQTPRSSSGQRTASPAVAWQRIRNRPQQPVAELERKRLLIHTKLQKILMNICDNQIKCLKKSIL